MSEIVEFNGNTIEVKSEPEGEQLYINGVRIPYYDLNGKFVLERDAYVPPSDTIVDAAKASLSKQEN